MPAQALVRRLKEAYWSWLARRADDTDAGTAISPHPWMDAVALNLPPERERLVYVDGGAYDGTMARRFLARFPKLDVYAFEPIRETYDKLLGNLAGVRGAVYPMALAEQTGSITMNFNCAPGTCSVLPRGPYSQKYFNHATTPVEQRSVPAISLDDWFAGSGLERVDILKLDLQGFEGRALKGAKRLLSTGIACIYTEVMFVPEYEGCSLFADIDTALRSHGYRLFNLYNLSTHSDLQLGSADALYVPDRAAAVQLRAAA